MKAPARTASLIARSAKASLNAQREPPPEAPSLPDSP